MSSKLEKKLVTTTEILVECLLHEVLNLFDKIDKFVKNKIKSLIQNFLSDFKNQLGQIFEKFIIKRLKNDLSKRSKRTKREENTIVDIKDEIPVVNLLDESDQNSKRIKSDSSFKTDEINILDKSLIVTKLNNSTTSLSCEFEPIQSKEAKFDKNLSQDKNDQSDQTNTIIPCEACFNTGKYKYMLEYQSIEYVINQWHSVFDAVNPCKHTKLDKILNDKNFRKDTISTRSDIKDQRKAEFRSAIENVKRNWAENLQKVKSDISFLPEYTQLNSSNLPCLPELHKHLAKYEWWQDTLTKFCSSKSLNNLSENSNINEIECFLKENDIISH